MMKNKKGFTIIELSLASAFLGILLITIALLVTHVITIYQKGMTIKSVNSIGEDLIDDFTRSIASSPATNPTNLCYSLSSDCYKEENGNYPGKGLIQQQSLTNVKLTSNGSTLSNVPAYGAVCTGKYSYIWNSGYILDDNSSPTYTKPGGGPFTEGDRATLTLGTGSSRSEYKNFRLLKLEDSGREICRNAIRDGSYNNPSKNYRMTTKVEVAELLEKSEDNLALYDFTIFKPTYHTSTRQAYYSGTFILATIRGGVNIMASGDFCTAEKNANLNTDFAYCAINKFNFATRATGKGANND